MTISYLKRIVKILLEALCFWRRRMTLKQLIANDCQTSDQDISSVEYHGDYTTVKFKSGGMQKIQLGTVTSTDLKNAYGNRFKDVQSMPAIVIGATTPQNLIDKSNQTPLFPARPKQKH